MKYEAKGAYTMKSPQQLGVDGNDGPREAEGLEGACWGVCGLWIVEQGDERDALVAGTARVSVSFDSQMCGSCGIVMSVCVTASVPVVCFRVLDITTVESPHRTHLTWSVCRSPCPLHVRHSIATRGISQ